MKQGIMAKLVKIFLILIIIIFVFFLYGHYINPSSFKVNEMPIIDKNLNSDYNGFKIAHFSDIHYGRTTFQNDLKKVVKELNNLKADIVVFTGDLFDNQKIKDDDKKLMIDNLNNIEAKLFKFAVIGDYDKKYIDDYINILEQSNFILLDNKAKMVYDNSSKPLNVVGISDTSMSNDLLVKDCFNIVLIHEPDKIKDIKNANLVLAGHSLGGQFKIPFIGGIRKIKGAEKYFDSFYQVNNTKLYISNGIGTQDMSFRFFNSPSINLYRLYNY